MVKQMQVLNSKIKTLKKKKHHPQAHSLEKDADNDSYSSGFADGVFESCLAELEVNSVEDNPVWILDLEATQHVTGNPEILTELKMVSHVISMLTAGKDSHNVARRGRILLKLSDGSIKRIETSSTYLVSEGIFFQLVVSQNKDILRNS
jgi:hypothetical protein